MVNNCFNNSLKMAEHSYLAGLFLQMKSKFVVHILEKMVGTIFKLLKKILV